MNARVHWAKCMIAAGGTGLPRYGSPEWFALPESDRRRIAAVVVAAECWATEADQLEERLRAEIELSRIAYKATEDAEYVARRDAHRAEWKQRNAAMSRVDRARAARSETYGEDYGNRYGRPA